MMGPASVENWLMSGCRGSSPELLSNALEHRPGQDAVVSRNHGPLCGDLRSRPMLSSASHSTARRCRLPLVRLEGANRLWRRVPPSELSIELVADGRRGRVTGLVEAP